MHPDVDDLLPMATSAMGTRFELVIPRRGRAEPPLRAAGEAALHEIERWHHRLSRFTPASDIAQLNRQRAGRVDAELFGLLHLCEVVTRDSGGAFDIAAASRGRAAAPSNIPAFTLDPDGHHIRLAPWAMLDLGAIGKGWALDRAAELLRDAGIASALLHGGTSSVLALGHPSDQTGWRVLIRSAGHPLACSLCDTALGVTAPAGHRDPSAPEPDPRADGTREHLIDPATGHGLISISHDTAAVIGPSAALCDAWSTALAVIAHRAPSPLPPGGAGGGLVRRSSSANVVFSAPDHHRGRDAAHGSTPAAPRLPPAYESHLHGPDGWVSSVPVRP